MKQLNNVIIPETAPEGHIIVLIGRNVWGCGKTLKEAIQNLRKSNDGRRTDFEAHICPDLDEPAVNDMGQYYSCSALKDCPHCK